MTAPAYKRPFRKRDEELDRYINLKLAALGLPVSRNAAGSDFLEIAGPLLRNYYQKDRQLGGWLCASDTPHTGLSRRVPQRRLSRTAPRGCRPTPSCWTAKAWPAFCRCR